MDLSWHSSHARQAAYHALVWWGYSCVPYIHSHRQLLDRSNISVAVHPPLLSAMGKLCVVTELSLYPFRPHSPGEPYQSQPGLAVRVTGTSYATNRVQVPMIVMLKGAMIPPAEVARLSVRHLIRPFFPQCLRFIALGQDEHPSVPSFFLQAGLQIICFLLCDL